MWSAGLRARRRIGMEILALIQPKAVARAGGDFGFTGKISMGFRNQRLKDALRPRIHIFLENKIDPPRFGRPDAEVGPARRDHLGTDRITAWQRRMTHALNSSISREAVAVHLKSGCR